MGSKRVAGYHPSAEHGDNAESLKAQGFYHKTAWRRLRLQALQRDHYLCQSCLRHGKITQATEVHHIIELESCPSLGLELSNLESLCWQCHEDTKHKKKERNIPGVKVIRVSNGVDEGFDFDEPEADPLAGG